MGPNVGRPLDQMVSRHFLGGGGGGGGAGGLLNVGFGLRFPPSRTTVRGGCGGGGGLGGSGRRVLIWRSPGASQTLHERYLRLEQGFLRCWVAILAVLGESKTLP